MIEFKLPDMTCGHCAGTVTQTVKLLDPDAKVTVDLGSQTVKVESQEEREPIARALAEAGYPPA